MMNPYFADIWVWLSWSPLIRNDKARKYFVHPPEEEVVFLAYI